MKSSQVAPETLARIAADLKRHDITHAMVAGEASKTSRRGTVSVSAVSRALTVDPITGQPRSKSANVVATARRMIRAAREAKKASAA